MGAGRWHRAAVNAQTGHGPAVPPAHRLVVNAVAPFGQIVMQAKAAQPFAMHAHGQAGGLSTPLLLEQQAVRRIARMTGSHGPIIGERARTRLRYIKGISVRLAPHQEMPATGSYSEAARRARAANSTSDEETTMSNLRLLDPVFSDSFDNVMRRFLAPMAFDMEPAPLLKMRVDVTENDQAYEVKADIPGVKKDDINVRIDGNVVQIDAEARSEKETKGNGDKVIRSERYQGTVSRTFSLACDIDEGKVDARYADGVLTLKLPKKAATSARKIAIQ